MDILQKKISSVDWGFFGQFMFGAQWGVSTANYYVISV